MLRTISALELRFCRGLNAYLALPSVRRSFLVVSRLGDGFAWYALIFAMPLLTGSSTPTAAVQMAVTGLIASGLQMVLKTSLARERPFVASPAIACGIAPLDR